MEHRIVELELKAAEQQHQLDELSGVIYKQQQELDSLRAAVQSLAQKLSGSEPGMIDDKPPERPPHY